MDLIVSGPFEDFVLEYLMISLLFNMVLRISTYPIANWLCYNQIPRYVELSGANHHHHLKIGYVSHAHIRLVPPWIFYSLNPSLLVVH